MPDAFEKLAGLVGASVEAAPGQGLPRTRAEALALGLPRYFTGKPCKHGHVADRRVTVGCSECLRQYRVTPEYKEIVRKYRASPQGKERLSRYQSKPEVKERIRENQRQYAASPKGRDGGLKRNLKKTGDAVLFAINQAELSALHARAYADIVPQCPEPHRSQLQALIERIRQDPTAGKAVIGLLRTMRELRKAELAQQRATESTTAAESNT